MSPTALFFALFALTLALLLAAVATGLRARRRAHIAIVALTVLALGATIWQAYRLGAHYDLASAGAITPVHMFLARAATLSFVPTAVLGLFVLRKPALRRWHGKLAWTSVALAVCAAVTGVCMLLAAQPK
ncbi:MAG: hypothetical protein EPO68_17550 [Planctomycetota bacterium]|nr:MAG: hypothetical protein EPO68_17550 [Planctomycetota bacterium]